MPAEQSQQQQPELRVPVAGHSASAVPSSVQTHRPLYQLSFRAMGVNCEVLTLGRDLTERAQRRVIELDQCWSRFREGSELSQFNANAGSETSISSDLKNLLEHSVEGFIESRGMFNPFMGQAIVDLGYDRDFDSLNTVSKASFESHSADSTWPALSENSTVDLVSPVNLDFESNKAELLPGFVLDSGGIGKGLGAQLVVAELLEQGAAGALVNLGGDVVVGGRFPDEGWRVGVGDELEDVEPLTVTLRSGSVCTSGISKRVWKHDGQLSHHIVTPIRASRCLASSQWRAPSPRQVGKRKFLLRPL